VSSEDAGELLTLDTQGRVLSRLAVGRQPEGVNLAPDGRSLLATSEEDNAVSLVHFSASGAQTIAATLPVGQQPRSSAFLPDGRAVVGGEFDASLTILSTGKTPRVLRTIHLAPEERPMSVKAGPATDGTVYVTTGRGGKLLKIDTADAHAQIPVLAAASVGERPWGLALSPDGTTGYTANGPGEDITVVDLRTMRVVGKIASPGGPWGIIAVPTR
jgi:DNA-binding beta-propeller fold protein YncE